MFGLTVSVLSVLAVLHTALALPVMRPRDSTKYVFAHHMVGNTYPYTSENWLSDINLAHANGIDAFALNMGSDSWQQARVSDAYAAATSSGTGFKMFISLDMSILPCTSSADAQSIKSLISSFSSNPAQFMYNGLPVVSTFSGETCTFGTANVADGWESVFSGMNVFFVPAFFPTNGNDFSVFGNVINGLFQWNAGWPTSLTSGGSPGLSDLLPAALQSLIGSLSPDNAWIGALGGKEYMASVSPAFFTHYGADSYNKNWIYVGDEHLYAERWENLVSARSSFNMVEVISWNDFGESHYIGPYSYAAQPNSQAWVDGFDHQGWLTLTKYYAEAFKTGQYPSITNDSVTMWARPHSRAAVATNDPVGLPTSADMMSDTLWAVALLSQPATVTLSTSPTNSKSFNLPAGANKISIPLEAGGPLHAVVTRNGVNTVDLQSSNYTFQPTTVEAYNFNFYVISSAS
ncbi:glycoside hydrolase [Clavulina sp. PMI_390]|nr:glycoside hydrolase [Clavulina sp. PMI_390]